MQQTGLCYENDELVSLSKSLPTKDCQEFWILQSLFVLVTILAASFRIASSCNLHSAEQYRIAECVKHRPKTKHIFSYVHLLNLNMRERKRFGSILIYLVILEYIRSSYNSSRE